MTAAVRRRAGAGRSPGRRAGPRRRAARPAATRPSPRRAAGCVLVGDGAGLAAEHLADAGLGTDGARPGTPRASRPRQWAAALAPVLDARSRCVVLPASPGRPRPGAPPGRTRSDRPLLAGAIEVGAHGADRRPPRRLVIEDDPRARARSSATLQPGVRGRRARRRRRTGAGTVDRAGAVVEQLAWRPPATATPTCSRCCRPTRPPWTWPRRRASSAAGPASTAPERFGQLAARRRRARRVDRRDPGRHRPRLGRPPAPDRHDRRRRRPRPLPRLRHLRRGAAHRGPRPPRPHRQREHRPALPDDGSWPTWPS